MRYEQIFRVLAGLVLVGLAGCGGGGGGGGSPALAREIQYFVGNDGVHGVELWKTDGTAAGTVMVKDINIAGNSNPIWFTEMNGIWYFQADDGDNGRELWRTDGTAAGTVRVKNIAGAPGASSSPSQLVVFNGLLYFAANDGVNGTELWKSDGTETGTTMVKNINAPGSASPQSLTVFGNALYFKANDGVTGEELWKSDGTEAGTIQVRDINPGAGSSQPLRLTVFRNIFVFDSAGIYFSANDGVNGVELWRTDGSEAGTIMVKDINPDAGNSVPMNLKAIGNTLYFSANDGVNGTELWKSDGTEAGTVMVRNINPAAVTVNTGHSNPGEFAEFGGVLYFGATTDIGRELWKSDGTEAGTGLVRNINEDVEADSYPEGFIAFNGALYFSASGGDLTVGRELWKTDGTEIGTVLVRNINPAPGASSFPGMFFPLNGALYFGATDGVNGYELWTTNGTESGTVMVKDACVGTCSGLY